MATQQPHGKNQPNKGKTTVPAKTGTPGATPPAKTAENVPAVPDGPMSARFTAAIIKEFRGTIGQKFDLKGYERTLAQHLFLKIDATLQELETKRTDQNKPPIIWANVNLTKLASDAMYRIQLGIDALLDGFLYPIPYLNSRTRLYDLDLRVGYKGKDFYRRGMALDPPVDIRYELVHETDQFTIRKKSFTNPVEDIDFEVPKPFNRGQVVGGFAHIIYKDKTKNQVILVTNEDFEKSKAKAQADNFWRDYPNEMKFKTIVNRATSKLIMDPKKVNAALFAVEYQDELSDAGRAQAEIDQVANKGTMLTMTQEGSTDGPSNEPEKTGAEPGSETIDMIKCPAKNNAEVPASDCPPCKDRPGCPSHESMDDTAGSTPAGETTEQGTQPASDQDKTKRAPGY